jgi:hypothetical protein
MTWLTAMVYLCHKLPRICYTCRKHFPVLSSLTTYYLKSNAELLATLVEQSENLTKTKTQHNTCQIKEQHKTQTFKLEMLLLLLSETKLNRIIIVVWNPFVRNIQSGNFHSKYVLYNYSLLLRSMRDFMVLKNYIRRSL